MVSLRKAFSKFACKFAHGRFVVLGGVCGRLGQMPGHLSSDFLQ